MRGRVRVFSLFLFVLLAAAFFGECWLVYGAPSQWETCTASDAWDSSIRGAYWRTQTFLVGGTGHTVTSVKLLLYRTGSPGTLTISIMATDANGKPTGSDLTSGTTNGDTLPTGSPYEWREISLTEYTLSASTLYAIVARATSGDTSNLVTWRGTNSDAYADGKRALSTNSGSTWGALSTADNLFEVWGNSLGGGDTTAPTYSNIAASQTHAAANTTFSIQWNDETALHTAGQSIFSTNNTGTWTNDTAVDFSATPSWANVTKTLNATVSQVVGYMWYAKDNAGNWNSTAVQTLTTTNVEYIVDLDRSASIGLTVLVQVNYHATLTESQTVAASASEKAQYKLALTESQSVSAESQQTAGYNVALSESQTVTALSLQRAAYNVAITESQSIGTSILSRTVYGVVLLESQSVTVAASIQAAYHAGTTLNTNFLLFLLVSSSHIGIPYFVNLNLGLRGILTINFGGGGGGVGGLSEEDATAYALVGVILSATVMGAVFIVKRRRTD